MLFSLAMERKFFSVLLYVVAGFFLYMVCILGFVNSVPLVKKWGIIIVFLLPALIALLVGLALRSFQNWRRDTGVVLLSASGFSAFLVFTMICFMRDEEFRRMMKPETLAIFGDYFGGGGFILSLAALGLGLIKAKP